MEYNHQSQYLLYIIYSMTDCFYYLLSPKLLNLASIIVLWLVVIDLGSLRKQDPLGSARTANRILWRRSYSTPTTLLSLPFSSKFHLLDNLEFCPCFVFLYLQLRKRERNPICNSMWKCVRNVSNLVSFC